MKRISVTLSHKSSSFYKNKTQIVVKNILIFICLLLFTYPAFAQTQTRNLRLVKPPTENLTSQKRKAVVIGMSEYGSNNRLDNTINDADDMADALTRLGFEIVDFRCLP